MHSEATARFVLGKKNSHKPKISHPGTIGDKARFGAKAENAPRFSYLCDSNTPYFWIK